MIRYFILKKHYLGIFPKNSKYVYGIHLRRNDGQEPMVGCCIFGNAWAQDRIFKMPEQGIEDEDKISIQKGKINLDELLNISSKQALNLQRFYVAPSIMNLESTTLRRCIKQVSQDSPSTKVITTYSWQMAGHVGTIYQSINAVYLGQSRVTRMYKYIFPSDNLNEDTKRFIKKYYDVSPKPSAKDIGAFSINMNDENVLKIGFMDFSMFKKYYKDVLADNGKKLSKKQIRSFENRLEKTFRKSKNHKGIKTIFDMFVYVFADVLHRRSPIMEKAILDKDFSEVKHQPSAMYKTYKKWPIMDSVVRYVKILLGGRWPEFEEKISNNSFLFDLYRKTLKKPIKEPDESSKEDFSFVDDTMFDVKHWIDEPEVGSNGETPEVPMI